MIDRPTKDIYARQKKTSKAKPASKKSAKTKTSRKKAPNVMAPCRLPLIADEAMTPAQRALMQSISSGPRGRFKMSGPFYCYLHAPGFGELAQKLGAHCRFGTSIPPRLSEFAILVTAQQWKSQYEWAAHAGIAAQKGVKPETIRDLQAGRAQTRFYTELENWLSSVTDLSSDIVVADTSKAESSEDIRLLSERLRSLQENGGGSNPRVATAMANLADGISGLVKNMRSEQQIMRDWVEAQSDEQKAMRNTLEKIADALKKQGVH